MTSIHLLKPDLPQDVSKFPPVSYRTSALWGRCPALSTTLLDLSKQGIGYRWPCAILGWLSSWTYKDWPLYRGTIWFWSLQVVSLGVLCQIWAAWSVYTDIVWWSPLRDLPSHFGSSRTPTRPSFSWSYCLVIAPVSFSNYITSVINLIITSR